MIYLVDSAGQVDCECVTLVNAQPFVKLQSTEGYTFTIGGEILYHTMKCLGLG
jgi:hypothetical protein